MRDRMRDARQQAVDAPVSAEPSTAPRSRPCGPSQLQLAEQASPRFTQALADVADVLTPEQRKQLAERIGRWHGRRG